MIRAWLAELIVRLYPSSVRDARGSEISATLLEAGDASVGAFCRELWSVAIAGLKARSRAALGRSMTQLALQAIGYGAIAIVARDLVGNAVVARGVLGDLTSVGWDPGSGGLLFDFVYYAGPVLILALFSLACDRAAGVIGLGWALACVHEMRPQTIGEWIAFVMLPIAGFLLMTARTGSPSGRPRVIWLLPAIAWAVLWSTALQQRTQLGYLLPVLAVVLVIPLAPEVALGTALSWSFLGALYLTTPGQLLPHLAIELFTAAPLVAILIVGSQYAISQHRRHQRPPADH